MKYKYEDIIKQFPSHSLAGNAQYWLGEVYTRQGNLSKATAAFKKGYEKYKNGNKYLVTKALEEGKITIEELLKNGLEVIKKEK